MRSKRRNLAAQGIGWIEYHRELGKRGGRPRKVTSAPATPRLAELVRRSAQRDAYNPW